MTKQAFVRMACIIAPFILAANIQAINLPPDQINLQVNHGTVSWFATTLSGVPPGYDVANKTYSTWCVDVYGSDPSAENGGAHTGSLATEYPGMALDKILYILNHKKGTVDDVQRAIWWFSSGLAPDVNANPLSVEMVADAEAHGGGYTPGPHGISLACIIWTAPNPGAQKCIIECPGPPDVDTNNCSDRFTAGGFIYVSGSKATFGIQGGIQNGRLWGGVNYIDHGTRMHVKSRTLTSYTALDANCRRATYDVTINGAAGTATVEVCDYGEPGRDDVVQITLSNGYIAGGATTLGGDGQGGGNVQLHKGSCNDAPTAQPSKQPKVKPNPNGNGNGNNDGNSNGNGNGNSKGKGKGNAKAKNK